MFEPPKELPPLNPTTQKKINEPQITNSNLIIKTENPVQNQENKKTFNIPVIEIPRSQEIILAPPQKRQEIKTYREEETSNFDEAIKSIHLDILKSNTPATEMLNSQRKQEEYYQPKNVGEGYFSEIKHFIKNKDVKEIIDDVLRKDFLTGMKDYHDQKMQGKPYYLHDADLKEKLEKKMSELMAKEENWHELNHEATELIRKKKALEKEIDEDSQELKELFKQIKINSIMEKESKPEEQFNLISGPKLRSLNDLRKAITYMHENEFAHHVTNEKNDFAEWTKRALELPEMAEKIRAAKTKQELENTLKNII